jgi:hypothetical protein
MTPNAAPQLARHFSRLSMAKGAGQSERTRAPKERWAGGLDDEGMSGSTFGHLGGIADAGSLQKPVGALRPSEAGRSLIVHASAILTRFEKLTPFSVPISHSRAMQQASVAV